MPERDSRETLDSLIQEAREKLPVQHIATEANCDADMVEKLSPEAQARFEKLGLENISFKMHSGDCTDMDLVKEKIKRGNSNVYILAHGWTGTNAMWDAVPKPPHGLTIVEEILLADPEAVIICPDGDGFGKTKFKKMDQEALADKCGPEDYADQMEFLINDIFDIPRDKRDRVFMMGHSLGGAMTTVAAGKGIIPAENCVAAAAFMPNIEGDKDQFSDKQSKAVLLRYAALSKVMALAQDVKALGRFTEGIADAVVDKVASLMLAAPLMGSEFPGSIDPVFFEKILEELYKIHIPEIRKADITSAVMVSLSRGVDLSKEHLGREKMSKVTKIMGEKDRLAPEMVSSTGITSLLDYEKEAGYSEGVQIIRNAGHVAVVYDAGELSPVRQLLTKVQAKNEEYYFELDSLKKEPATI